jgi:ABC-type transport system involved in cytochrome c biogenesis ATPase subunit
VIPDNAVVRAVLGKLRRGSVVELAGELVDIEGENGSMRTSLTRVDTGAGACEVLLARSARIVEHK